MGSRSAFFGTVQATGDLTLEHGGVKFVEFGPDRAEFRGSRECHSQMGAEGIAVDVGLVSMPAGSQEVESPVMGLESVAFFDERRNAGVARVARCLDDRNSFGEDVNSFVGRAKVIEGAAGE